MFKGFLKENSWELRDKSKVSLIEPMSALESKYEDDMFTISFAENIIDFEDELILHDNETDDLNMAISDAIDMFEMHSEGGIGIVVVSVRGENIYVVCSDEKTYNEFCEEL